MDYGVDVSNHNAVNDWAAVRGNGITFASILLTQGDYFASPDAAAQVSAARAAGITPGGYHFGDPNVSVAANVSAFVTRATALGVLSPGSFLPMLDVEQSSADGITWTADTADAFVRDWIAGVRAATGVRRIAVYANLSFWQGLLHPDAWADGDTYLWLALYNGSPGDTGGYTHPRLALHQHTDQGNVPGVAGSLDRDVTVGSFTLSDLTLTPAADTGGDLLVALEQWKQDRIFERILSMSQGVAGQNFDGDQFAREEQERQALAKQVTDLATAVADLAAKVDKISAGGVDTADLAAQVAAKITVTGTVQATGAAPVVG
ncbi:hypothetical protein GCM10010174_61370 [Kutzneria viridogrisea]|uniref:GH25 family lysozyme M1 (1,4-beta-N-acetylmuramidase) n=1 Tax=Kutzneria viridogrisea TaxID=47990 RepID=A0ABR6BGD6_9PSEU|nr:GH25 family lysozyme M1 (1,4-beta-N-acetylmuramidase) [Kutzneria viridogrisea]